MQRQCIPIACALALTAVSSVSVRANTYSEFEVNGGVFHAATVIVDAHGNGAYYAPNAATGSALSASFDNITQTWTYSLPFEVINGGLGIQEPGESYLSDFILFSGNNSLQFYSRAEGSTPIPDATFPAVVKDKTGLYTGVPSLNGGSDQFGYPLAYSAFVSSGLYYNTGVGNPPGNLLNPTVSLPVVQYMFISGDLNAASAPDGGATAGILALASAALVVIRRRS